MIYTWNKKTMLAIDEEMEVDADGAKEQAGSGVDADARRRTNTNLYRAGAPFAAARRIVTLAFNFSGSRLLVGTKDGTLFYYQLVLAKASEVGTVSGQEPETQKCEWRCVWQVVHPDHMPFTLAHFSPDTAYFCTVNEAQRCVVSVWFGVRVHASATQSGPPASRTRLRFQQFTLPHPEPIVCVQWRNFNGTIVPM